MCVCECDSVCLVSNSKEASIEKAATLFFVIISANCPVALYVVGRKSVN